MSWTVIGASPKRRSAQPTEGSSKDRAPNDYLRDVRRMEISKSRTESVKSLCLNVASLSAHAVRNGNQIQRLHMHPEREQWGGPTCHGPIWKERSCRRNSELSRTSRPCSRSSIAQKMAKKGVALDWMNGFWLSETLGFLGSETYYAQHTIDSGNTYF